MKKKLNSGQALLIILLIMAVGLTIGLSVVSRSVTDIRISQEQEESSRAFSAAEAGLEHLLAGGSEDDLLSFGDFNINTATRNLGGAGETGFVFPKEIKAGNTQTVWLVDHDSDGNLDFGSSKDFSDFTFHWGTEGKEDTEPALEAYLIYDDAGIKTKRVAFDPVGGRSDGFTGASSGGHSFKGERFLFQANFTDSILLPSGSLYAIRIKLLYNDESQLLGIETSGIDDLPLQGHCYQVTAVSQAETGISRKVEQCQLYKTPPAIFDYVLFSEESLSK